MSHVGTNCTTSMFDCVCNKCMNRNVSFSFYVLTVSSCDQHLKSSLVQSLLVNSQYLYTFFLRVFPSLTSLFILQRLLHDLSGHVREQQPPEDDRGGCYKRYSLRVVFTPKQTRPDTLKQDKQAKDLRGGTEEQTGRNEDRDKDPAKKFYTRQVKNLMIQTHSLEAAAQMYEPKSGVPEEPKDQSFYDVEPDRDTVQVQQKTQEDSSEHADCNDQTKTSKSLMMLPFVPSDVLFHPLLCHLGQSMLRGFVEYQDIVTKISRIAPLIPGPLSRWILELEDKLKNVAGNVSNQPENTDRGSTRPFKDSPEGGQTPVNQSAAGSSTKTKNHLSVSGAKKPEEKQSRNDPKATICHYSEPLKTTVVDSGLDQGLVFSIIEDQAAGLVTATSQQGVHRTQSFVVPVGETQFKQFQTLSTNPEVHQTSNVQRFIEITTGDVEVLIVPETLLVSLQEGTIGEDERTELPAGPDPESVEVLVKNGCEEVGGGVTAPQRATQQNRQPAMEVVSDEVKVSPVMSGGKRVKGFSLNNKKHKHRSDCKTS